MEKKSKKRPSKEGGSENLPKKVDENKNDEPEETVGFPDGVDFKKFLGCGG